MTSLLLLSPIKSSLRTWLKRKCSGHGITDINPTTGKEPIIQRRVNSHAPLATRIASGCSNWLKVRWFYGCRAPYIIQGSKGSQDVCFTTQVIELSTLQGMMHEFRAVCWSSTRYQTRYHGIATLRPDIYQTREQAAEGEQEDDFFEEEQLYSIAHGFEVSFYKDMGSAYATMNVASSSPILATCIRTLEEQQQRCNHQRTLQSVQPDSQ